MRRLLLVLLLLVSCSEETPSSVQSFVASRMSIPYRIQIGHPLNSAERNQVQRIIDQAFKEIDQTYNNWNPNSEISRLNDAEAGRPIPLSPKLESFLLTTEKIVHLTGGRFDPTIAPLQKLWQNALKNNALPTQAEIDSLAPAIGWHTIQIKDHTLTKSHGKTQLDLGGIAKGYAIDLLAERLMPLYSNFLIEWGGEMRSSGEHPDNRSWHIAITKLGYPGDTSFTHDLQNLSVACSGDYLQNYTVAGVTYSHILDTHTMRPLISTLQTPCSATVLAKTCLLADALATAALTFSTPEEARHFLAQKNPEHPFWVFSRME